MRPTHLELFQITGQLEQYLLKESMDVINNRAYNTVEEYRVDKSNEVYNLRYINFLQVYRDITIVKNITSRKNDSFEYMSMLIDSDFKMFAEIINHNVKNGNCKDKSLCEPIMFVSQFQPNHSVIRFVFGFYALGDTIYMKQVKDYNSELKQQKYRKQGFVFEGGEGMLSLGEVHRNIYTHNDIQNPNL